MKKLKDIKGLLSREEMRQIQGGCGSGCISCSSNGQCASGVCANWGGDCARTQCGCGGYCL